MGNLRHACMMSSLKNVQEAGSYRPAVRPERRRAMVAELVNAVPAALQVLATCLERHHGEPALICSVAVCMRSCAQQPFAFEHSTQMHLLVTNLQIEVRIIIML